MDRHRYASYEVLNPVDSGSDRTNHRIPRPDGVTNPDHSIEDPDVAFFNLLIATGQAALESMSGVDEPVDEEDLEGLRLWGI